MRIRTTRPSGVPRLARRLAAAVASAALVCAPTAFAAAPAAPRAQAAPAATAAEPAAPEFLSLSIDKVTPTVVRADGPAVVTVSGTVRNVGDRDVSDVAVRLQRAPRITDGEQVRSVLSLDQSSFGTVGLFHSVADTLGTGSSAPFTVSLPLQDPLGLSLAINEPGVYPLLVNVNGTPDYGGPARLDDARFLLPVMSLPSASPGTSGAGADADRDGQGPAAPTPVPVTTLIPLAARPEIAAGQPGEPSETAAPTRLVSDELAVSLAAGGRLYGLVHAVDEALTPESDPHGALAAGTCLAIDPDLLVTVEAMSRGYTIAGDPADPESDTRSPDDESAGQAAASAWLQTVRGLASRMCTVAVPYAQADLEAVQRLGSPELSATTLRDPADIVDSILGVHSLRGLVWPATGQLTPDSAAALAAPPAQDDAPGGPPGDAAQAPAVLLADTAVSTSTSNSTSSSASAAGAASGDAGGGTARIALPAPQGASLGSVLFDMPAAAALAAAGAEPSTPSFVPEDLRYRLDHDSRPARLQDALGALAWPLLEARDSGGSTADGAIARSASGSASGTAGSASEAGSGAAPPQPLVIAPPQDFSIDHDEAAQLLSFLQSSFDDGLAVPRALADAVTAARLPGTARGRLTDPRPGDGVADFDDDAAAGGAGTSGGGHTGAGPSGDGPATDDAPDGVVDDRLVDRLTGTLPTLATLSGMLAGPSPDHFLAPLYRDLARTVSTSGLGGPRTGEAADAARARAAGLASSLDRQIESVTVLAPGSVYTLASSQSPLLVVAQNDLPVPVNVGLRIVAPAGVQIGQASDYTLPARGSRQIQIPAQIEFSRQIDLRVQLLAPDGVPVGEQVHISLHSNAYGMVIPVITGISGALLLFLAGRRGWHRLRGQHDRADDRSSDRGPVLEEFRDDVAHRGPEDKA